MSGARTLVLGLGNPLMGDDGAGLAALARLREEWELPPEVELTDGGTWGMNLLPILEGYDRVILLDAIHSGQRPGALTLLQGDELPRLLGQKLSPHQVDFREVLALAELRGTLPGRLTAIGVQPERMELGAGLSPRVAQAIRQMVALAIEQLEWLGHHCAPRELACA